MVKPAFLANDDVQRWLGGIEPAWCQLDFDSYCRLRRRPGESDRALTLASDLAPEDVAGSALIGSTLTLLEMAGDGGIKLTGTGNLPRTVVAKLAKDYDRPPFDAALIRSVSKVLTEADVWPVELLRHTLLEGRLLRRQSNRLLATTKGRRALAASGADDLLATLFETMFWRINLAHWDGYPVPPWPQSDIGIIAWALSIAATQWETPVKLARLATVPVIGVLEAKDDFAGQAFDLRILRLLAALGLLEAQDDPNSESRFLPTRRYRKAPLYARFFTFEVSLEPMAGTRH